MLTIITAQLNRLQVAQNSLTSVSDCELCILPLPPSYIGNSTDSQYDNRHANSHHLQDVIHLQPSLTITPHSPLPTSMHITIFLTNCDCLHCR